MPETKNMHDLVRRSLQRGDHVSDDIVKRLAREDRAFRKEAEARGLNFSAPAADPLPAQPDLASTAMADPIPVMAPNPVDAGPTVTVKREAPTYTPDGQHSLFRDMAYMAIHSRSIDAAIAAGRRAVGDIGFLRYGDGGIEDVKRRRARHDREMRDVTAAGDGIGFQIPYYFGPAVATAARATSKAFDITTQRPMPEYGQEIDVPVTSTGISAAVYEENAAITETDIASTLTGSPVVTLAAEVEVSWQLLERSRGLVDQVVASDATAALGARLDLQLLSGTGSNGEMTGLLNQNGITETTYTDASPTVAEWRAKLWTLQRDVIVASGREPDVLVWGPTRAAWTWSGTDTVNRQALGQDYPAPGVIVSAVPTALGSGTNEDRALLLHRDSVYLYTSPVTYSVFDSVLSASGTIRLQARMYAALAVRTPAAVGVLKGTGTVVPSI
jgi:hypothetical protein